LRQSAWTKGSGGSGCSAGRSIISNRSCRAAPRWRLTRLSCGPAARAIPDANRLHGNLTHALAQAIFQPGKPPTPEAAAASVRSLIERQIDELAAPLRLPEHAAALSEALARLGVGVALGEIAQSAAMAAAVGADPSLWSARASCSAGVELRGMEIVVMGMSDAWAGPLRIDHAVMADGLDIDPVRAALRRLGARFDGQLPPAEAARVCAVLAKAEAPRSGQVRGWRHTMLDDSDIAATRQARAFAAGALAAQTGHAALFVSGGAEHQGPDGGGPCAILYDASSRDQE